MCDYVLLQLQYITMGHVVLPEATIDCYGLLWLTNGSLGLLVIAMSYNGLLLITADYNGLLWVTIGY